MSIFPTDVPRCRAQFTSPLVIDPGAYSSFYAFYAPIGDGVALRSAPLPASVTQIFDVVAPVREAEVAA